MMFEIFPRALMMYESNEYRIYLLAACLTFHQETLNLQGQFLQYVQKKWRNGIFTTIYTPGLESLLHLFDF